MFYGKNLAWSWFCAAFNANFVQHVLFLIVGTFPAGSRQRLLWLAGRGVRFTVHPKNGCNVLHFKPSNHAWMPNTMLASSHWGTNDLGLHVELGSYIPL